MYSDNELKELAKYSKNSKIISKIITTDPIWVNRIATYPPNWTNSRMLYHWFYHKNDIKIPVCKVCNIKEVSFVSYTKGYKIYCSSQCCNSSNSWKDSVKSANLQKYGVSSVMKIASVKSRLSNTMLEKYGVDNFSKSNLFKEKYRETCLRKYGVKSPMHLSNIRDKIRQTYVEKYGVSSPNKVASIKEKKRQTWLKKYGYDNPSKVPSIIMSKIATMQLNGFIKSDEEKGAQQIYYDKVAEITKKNWIEHFYKINPRKLTRSFDEYHLDHVFSIIEGFENDILPEIIGHWTNLRLIPKLENIRKQRRSDKSIEQLINDYECSRTIPN